ncbi:SLC13 family permease [Phragmitibacter flavus]|uniref:SLC13 family permease n=1 Tax=Phragmitibacter flavus TaxID=2576071 RepID=A0A5R8KIV4_9BACT|nr:SLC13 family permease [Phragmitibacter flavus]TLD72258.1 SLC13 family permease [Phragmitibacter flavus]
MTFEIGIVLALLAIAVLCFSFEWVAAEIVALGLMLAFVISGVLSPEQAFAGFASDTVMMILGLLLMTTVLSRTGLMEVVSRQLLRATGQSPTRFLWLMMISVGFLSAFVSNTATTAFFIPVVLAVARRMKTPGAMFLLPLAFASILASSVSLIATSTNLVVSGLMQNLGMPAMDMFELAPVGLPILLLGIVYIGLIGLRLLPKRHYTSVEDELKEGKYLGELVLTEGSSFAGKTLVDSRLGEDYDLNVLRIVRNKDQNLRPRGNVTLRDGDVLLVEGPHDALLRIKDMHAVQLKADAKLSALSEADPDTKIVEALLLPKSTLIGRSLKDARFRDRFGVIALGLQHKGRAVRKMSQVNLAVGDVLLLQGPPGELATLQDMGAFRMIGEPETKSMPALRAGLMAACFIIALLIGIFKIAPLPVAVLGGAFAMLASGLVSPEVIYREVEWKAVILIACMLSVGAAMQASGADQLIGQWINHLASGLSPRWLIAGIFLLTVALSQPMSNQAAAALVLPIAVAAAVQMDLNPRALAMTVAVAASCSFLTPLEPACLMVYGPGGYRFRDFFLVGLPLSLGILVITLVLIPVFWPL